MDMKVMNTESRKRFRPSQTIREKMMALQLEGGDSEHKGTNTPPEIQPDEFCIDLFKVVINILKNFFHHVDIHIFSIY